MNGKRAKTLRAQAALLRDPNAERYDPVKDRRVYRYMKAMYKRGVLYAQQWRT